MIVIRADSFVNLGTGHVMRCIALAQAAQKQGKAVIFAISPASEGIIDRIKSESFEIAVQPYKPGSEEDAEWTVGLAREKQARWAVVDGYHFDGKYQSLVKSSGLNLLFIDDYGHCKDYCADLILNQNITADKSLYESGNGKSKLLLGARYALLREEFKRAAGFRREHPEKARKILVTLGGSDPGNVTLFILRALEKIEDQDIQAKILAGAANPHLESLEKAIKASDKNFELIHNASDMPELLKWADVAISAAGSSCWEFCLLGLPCAINAIAENQQPIADALTKMGAAVLLNHENIEESCKEIQNFLDNKELRKSISLKQRKIIDGKGADRVAANMAEIKIRDAKLEDCKFVWELSNDPEVRKVSFSSSQIPWEEHKKWYDKKLKDGSCRFFIIENDAGLRMAQVRCQLEKEEAVISISIHADFRGLGCGSRIISGCSETVFRENGVSGINALIKPSNISSVRTFLKAGYIEKGKASVKKENDALLYFLKRQDK